MPVKNQYTCCIIGAGPAGLGCAWELARHGVTDVLIIDRNDVPGGLARTVEAGGCRFDIGPHRFFTKNREVYALWKEVLGDDFRPVNRLTRIYYNGKLFHYPIRAFDVMRKLGFLVSLQAAASFFRARFAGRREAVSFEDWISQKFGRKLYSIFFKSYTEKVWGIPCSGIAAEWAAQRIKGLNFTEVVRNMLSGRRKNKAKTLVEQFDYPVKGAGQLYEAMTEALRRRGVEVVNGSTVSHIHTAGNEITGLDMISRSGDTVRITAAHYFSSAPITHFFGMLSPAPPPDIAEAAGALYYREHITVNLAVEGESLFPDQWIYVHDPEIKAARIANYNNFSGSMAGSAGVTALSVEYFAFRSDDVWKMDDDALIALATEELGRSGLLKACPIRHGSVVRETESYPAYYLGYEEPYRKLKDYLAAFRNLGPIGRGGLYKYNNQDHSTYSGMLAARNFLKLPGSPYDVWKINVDAEYIEGGSRQWQ